MKIDRPARTAPVFALAVLLAGCASTAPTTSVTPAPALAVPERHWGYAAAPDTAGPAEWGSLPDGAACGTGTRQSPIDLATRAPFPVEAKDLPNLDFHYGTTKLHLANDGHTIQLDVDKGSSVGIEGATWPLLQLHFHAPSEHSLDGLHYPMEMHLVHGGPDGKPGLVVAVFIVQGGDNPSFAALLADLPREKGGRRDDSAATVHLAELLPLDRTYLAYAGSLTTPPCTEGIRWYVLKSPAGVAGAQVTALGSLPRMTPNNRPVQPLAGRKVLLDAKP
jgi:carbonic anhydrase